MIGAIAYRVRKEQGAYLEEGLSVRGIREEAIVHVLHRGIGVFAPTGFKQRRLSNRVIYIEMGSFGKKQ